MLAVEFVMNGDSSRQQKITPMHLCHDIKLQIKFVKVHRSQDSDHTPPSARQLNCISIYDGTSVYTSLFLYANPPCLHCSKHMRRSTTSRAQQTQKYLHQGCLKIEWNSPLVQLDRFSAWTRSWQTTKKEPSLEIYSQHFLVQGSGLFHLPSSLCIG